VALTPSHEAPSPTPVAAHPTRTAANHPQDDQNAAAASQTPAQPDERNAPRTHRLDQATANNLRAGWLAARRRGEVTISQQEYAGRIIALGLAAEAQQLAEYDRGTDE